MKDVGLGNYGNALYGFLLCVTIPFPYGRRFWNLSSRDNSAVVAYTTVCCNFLYILVYVSITFRQG